VHTAIIGMGPGLGASLARRFGQQGHRLSVVARSSETLDSSLTALRVAGVNASGYRGDAADSVGMAAVFREMSTHDGEIDTLVFNVALIKPDRFVTSSSKARLSYGKMWLTRGNPVSLDEFMESLRANVGAALICVKQVAEQMCDRRSGKILITGGTLGLSPWIEWASLSAGKAALRSLTRSLFAELRPFNVHAALVTIHDTIAANTPYGSDEIAEFYWDLTKQEPELWASEYHFNPDGNPSRDRDLIPSN
jgi:short-subunit dehydrogenase